MNRLSLLSLLPAVALFSGCLFSDDTSSSGTSASKVFVMGTKYANDGGSASLQSVDSVATDIKTYASSDVVLDGSSKILYVLQRGTGAVTGYTDGDKSKPVLDVNMGAGSNPYAVASVSGRLWVACYGSSFLKAVDESSSKLVDSIDLKSYAVDSSGIPHTSFVRAWNGKLVVVLGRMKGWDPGDSALVLVINPSSKSVEKRIALPWKNAYGQFDLSGNQLLVSCVGAWATDDYSALVLDGGLALVDLNAGTAKTLLNETDAKGNITGAGFGPTGTVFVQISDASYQNSISSLSTSGTSLTKISGNLNASAFAWNGTSLWVGSGDAKNPAVVRMSAAGVAEDTVKTALSPSSIQILGL